MQAKAEEISEMENLEKRTETTDAILTNRVQEIKERISGVEHNNRRN